jgi:hypothetical protein|nr:MAG TPA: hypothetical protein [Caudoviricetes sp.]
MEFDILKILDNKDYNEFDDVIQARYQYQLENNEVLTNLKNQLDNIKDYKEELKSLNDKYRVIFK